VRPGGAAAAPPAGEGGAGRVAVTMGRLRPAPVGSRRPRGPAAEEEWVSEAAPRGPPPQLRAGCAESSRRDALRPRSASSRAVPELVVGLPPGDVAVTGGHLVAAHRGEGPTPQVVEVEVGRALLETHLPVEPAGRPFSGHSPIAALAGRRGPAARKAIPAAIAVHPTGAVRFVAKCESAGRSGRRGASPRRVGGRRESSAPEAPPPVERRAPGRNGRGRRSEGPVRATPPAGRACHHPPVADAPLTRLREICRGLPEVEAEGDRHVGFSIRGRRFAWYMDDHHGDGRLALACKAAPGVNEGLAASDPSRYFIPSYVHPLLRRAAGMGRRVARHRPGGLGGGAAAGARRVPAHRTAKLARGVE
jgi:hypothetical protein